MEREGEKEREREREGVGEREREREGGREGERQGHAHMDKYTHRRHQGGSKPPERRPFCADFGAATNFPCLAALNALAILSPVWGGVGERGC